MHLILASNSPRRKEILRGIYPEFTVEPSLFQEHITGDARRTALSLAEGKAREVFGRFQGCFVLGADTVVSFEGRILGKPENKDDAVNMLTMLSGNTHSVITGVCLIGKDFFKTAAEETFVTFRTLSKQEILDYVKSGSPMDKAGAYGIQDKFTVKSYKGSYTNVVGLPKELTAAMLKEGGIC